MISCISKRIFHLIGWKLVGRFPLDLDHLIIIVAPHTSNWDFPLGILVKLWLKIDAKYYAKASLFKWPLGPVMKSLGGRPVDRKNNQNIVSEAVLDFKNNQKHRILITPEGTRDRRETFKTGFYYIAVKSGAGVLPIIFDYGVKEMRILPVRYMRGDGQTEVDEVRNLFKGVEGKHPEHGVF